MNLYLQISLIFVTLLVSGELSHALTQCWSGKIRWHEAKPHSVLPVEKEAAEIATIAATTISAITLTPTTVTQGIKCTPLSIPIYSKI